MLCDHIIAATASTPKAQKSERMRGMHLEGVGAANKLSYALARLSQVRHNQKSPQEHICSHFLMQPGSVKYTPSSPEES